eukprot:1007972-Pleurochrysis_carterae.AAC.2
MRARSCVFGRRAAAGAPFEHARRRVQVRLGPRGRASRGRLFGEQGMWERGAAYAGLTIYRGCQRVKHGRSGAAPH